MERFARIVNGYDYFCNISFSRDSFYEKDVMFLNADIVFTPKVFT